ncbi:MAG TPA: VOC family protein [Burkholderiales bacterium]|nr:VOC family protein [Burkholderiales bacterium]
MNLTPNLPLRLHHYAWVTKDHEANRKFFEDVLGMPLIATWCERAHVAEVGRELEYCHAFYGLADGGAIAFFQFADPQMYELFKAQHPKQARFGHIALKVDRKTFEDTERRLKAADIKYRITDHGYCQSLYMMTPDELKLEFTLDPDNVAEIDAMRRADAHSELKRWLAGDRKPNNSDHKSVFK